MWIWDQPRCIDCPVLINKIKQEKLVFVSLSVSSVAISIIYRCKGRTWVEMCANLVHVSVFSSRLH